MIHISEKSIVNFYDADPGNIQSMLINCFKTEVIKYHPFTDIGVNFFNYFLESSIYCSNIF